MTEQDWYTWVILPLIVFIARAIDVGIGTLRIIFTSRGKRQLAPLLGFVEVFIWIAIISQITRGSDNIMAYLAYAGGFALGNYVGMKIEDRLALGKVVIRTILSNGGADVAANLRQAGFGSTVVNGDGANGPVKLIYTLVPRRSVGDVVNIIHESHPKAFFSVEEVRDAQDGIFPADKLQHQIASQQRKGK